MNKDLNNIKYSRNTFIITIIFLILSFCAILCIQRVIDSGKYKGVDSFEINDASNFNSNGDSNLNDDNNSNPSKNNKSNTNSNKTSKSNSNKKSTKGKKSTKSKKSNKNKNKTSNKKSNSNGKGESYQEEIRKQKDIGEVEYVVTKNKDIFENKYFDNKKIAPGVSGTYEFDVINNRKSKVKYKINTSNTNNSNINLQYRLKRDNEYVIGNESTWVKINNLSLNDVLLNSKSTHSYILEWKWPYEDGIDNIDTQIGKDGNSKYELNISVYAEEV